MKIKSEIIWAILLIGTATVSYYLGFKTGTLETDENLKISREQKAEKILSLENKVQQLSEELTSRGIYSYPQASVISKHRDSTATVLIHLNGRDPIKSLEIERKQIINYSRNTKDNFEESGLKKTTAFIGTLNAHNPVTFELDWFKEATAIDLTFKSEQNRWHQYIRASKTPEGEIRTFWIITNKDSEVIDKHIDEGFPVDKDGNLALGADREVKYSEIVMNSIFRLYATEKGNPD